MRLPVRKLVRIHLDTGRTFEGILATSRGEFVTLKASTHESGGKMVPSDGVTALPKSRIEWVQIL